MKLQYNYYYKNVEDHLPNNQDKLKEMGLYPKNRDILLNTINNSSSIEMTENYWNYWLYCESSDIEFLHEKIDTDIFRLLVVHNQNLSLSFLRKTGFVFQHSNFIRVIKRTYCELYYFIKDFPDTVSSVPKTRPKSKTEKEILERLLKIFELNIYVPERFNVSRIPIEDIHKYMHGLA